MRNALFAIALAASLLGASEARAQYANSSIGGSVGFLKLDQAQGLDWALPLGLFYTTYLEEGFDAVAHVYGMLLTEPISGRQVIGVMPSVSIRYLLFQDVLRPYVGASLSYLHIFRDAQAAGVNSYVGFGPKVGFDYFLSRSMSAGLRAQYNLFYNLNQPLQSSFGVTVEVAAYY